MIVRRAFVLALALLATPPAQAEMPPALGALIMRYRCPIYDRLVRIHGAGDPADDHQRYLVVALPAGRYVQCHFHDRDRSLYCEAASGFYDTRADVPRTGYVPKAAVAALARLGFSTDDSHGNFNLDRAIGDSPDYLALADLILTALYVGYDARADMALEITAPFAPLPDSTCDAVG